MPPRTLLSVALVLLVGIFFWWLWAFGPGTPVPQGGAAAAPEPMAGAAATAEPAAAGTADGAETVLRTEVVAAAGPTWTLRGRVLADPRTPLTGAEVVAYRGKPGDRGGFMAMMALASSRNRFAPEDLPFAIAGEALARTAVAADGTFAFEVRPRHLRLVLQHDCYGLGMPHIVQVPATARAATVVLAPYLGGCVRGRLLGGDAAAVDGVRLLLQPDPMSVMHDPEGFLGAILQASGQPAKPGADGTFVFRAVTAGAAFLLSVESDEVAGRAQQPGLEAGEVREVAVGLKAASSLAVRVVDGDGAAVAAASVTSVRDPERSAAMGEGLGRVRAKTGEDGRAVLRGLADGEHELQAEARGFVPARANVAVPAAGETTIALDRGGSVAGVVVDAEGRPVAGAKVAAVQSMDVPLLGDLTAGIGVDVIARTADDGVATDAEGRFELQGIDGDAPFHVVAAHEQHCPGLARDVRAGRSDVRIVLEAGASLSARAVAGEDGAPLRDLQVQLLTTMFVFLERPLRDETVSGAEDGRVRLEGLPAGSYTLAVQCDERSEATVAVTLTAGQHTDVGELRLLRAAGVRGRVVDELGKGIAGASVARSRGGMRDNPMLAMMLGGAETVRTDDEGRFELAGLPAGRLQLSANARGFAGSKSARLELKTGQVLEGVEIALDHGGSVAGKLRTAEGEAADEFLVMVQSEQNQAAQSCTPAADGTFRVDNLEPGRYQVQAMHPSVLAAMQQPPEDLRPGRGFDWKGMMEQVTDNVVSQRCVVRAGETTTVELDAAELEAGTRLTVTVAIGGRKLESGMVEATLVADGRLRGGFLQDGEATFGALRPGPVRLQVRSGLTMAPVGAPQLVEIPTGTDHHRAAIDLPGGEIEGRVVDVATGRPLPAVLVRLLREGEGDDDLFGTAISDADGVFTFRALTEGTYGLVAADVLLSRSETGAASRQDGIRVAAGERRTGIELRAQPAVGATVRVSGDGGAPLPGAMLVAVDAEGRPFGAFGLAIAGQDGEAQLGGLPRGSLRIVGRAPGYAPDATELFEALPGQNAELQLRLRRGTRVVLDAVGRDGVPLLGADVRARCNGGTWFPAMLLLEGRGRGGQLELGRLAPGEWEFRVEHPRTGAFTVRRTVADGATVTVLGGIL